MHQKLGVWLFSEYLYILNYISKKIDFVEIIKVMHVQSKTELKDLVESDAETQSNKYWPYVREIDRVIKERFPFGAFNRKDVVQEIEMLEDERKAYSSAWSLFIKETKSAKEKEAVDVNKLADISQTLLLGDCGFFSSYALGYLRNKYPDLAIELVQLKVHTLLVFGREASSDIKDIKTWGKDALLYDPWANKSFPASQFFEIQKNTPNIPFYGIADLSALFIGIDDQDNHYLRGNPEVNIENSHTIKIIIDWVKEDQKRLKQLPFLSPTHPLPIPPSCSSNDIETLLKQLSKCKGWVFNPQSGKALFECSSKQQANRVLQTLLATKAVVVLLKLRLDNKTPTVVCTDFDYIKFQKLASPFIVNETMGIDREFWGVPI